MKATNTKGETVELKPCPFCGAEMEPIPGVIPMKTAGTIEVVRHPLLPRWCPLSFGFLVGTNDVDAWQTRVSDDDYRTLHDAAKELVLKLKVVLASEAYKSVWTLAQIHNGPYDGPQFFEEMRALADLVGLVPRVSDDE